jgi:hypothetical protein
MMETDQLLLLATLVAAVVPWAMSIHAKVSTIAHAMEGLPELVRESQLKIERHEQAIQALQKAAAAGH